MTSSFASICRFPRGVAHSLSLKTQGLHYFLAAGSFPPVSLSGGGGGGGGGERERVSGEWGERRVCLGL